MIGFVYALLSAIVYGGTEALKKKATEKHSIEIIFWAIVTFATPVFAILLWVNGIPQIDPKFWLIIAIDTPLLIFTNILFIRAEKISPISTTLPLLSFTPVFLIFTSYILLGELPNTFGFIGIGLVVLGVLFLKGEELRKGFGKEIDSLFSDRGARYMILVAFIWSFNANFSKMGIETSSIWMYIFVGVTVEALFMNAWLLKKYKKKFIQKVTSEGGILVAASVANMVAVTLYLFAIEHILVSYVIAFKRAGFILGGIIFGAFAFKEKNVRYRIGGALIMLTGVIIILVFH